MNNETSGPMIDLFSDEHFMREALRQAMKAAALDEVPVGAVIVKERRVIARAHNTVETLKDATAHAEILAITQASQAVGDWRLEGCTLFVTKEPCPMCAGAIVLSRVQRLVFGAPDPKGGGAGGLFDIVSHPSLNHRAMVTSGVLGAECAGLLKEFFALKRRPPMSM
ncbi:MAG: tRNA adenosine(34) deaminase TadA [Verrucomicrobiae bacterium]|nr:tRNA adenosine(34) deaminase TadA [Verrucomicrobiae bacterium]